MDPNLNVSCRTRSFYKSCCSDALILLHRHGLGGHHWSVSPPRHSKTGDRTLERPPTFRQLAERLIRLNWLLTRGDTGISSPLRVHQATRRC